MDVLITEQRTYTPLMLLIPSLVTTWELVAVLQITGLTLAVDLGAGAPGACMSFFQSVMIPSAFEASLCVVLNEN